MVWIRLLINLFRNLKYFSDLPVVSF